MLYIGIDPGTSCGWAVLNEVGERIDSGTWNLSKPKGEKPSLRFLRLSESLRSLIDNHPDCVVGYDLVIPYGSGDALAMYYKCVGRVEEVLDDLDIRYVGVRPGQYKKHATGKGNAKKEETVEAACQRWPELADSIKHDEGDALWIADCVRAGIV